MQGQALLLNRLAQSAFTAITTYPRRGERGGMELPREQRTAELEGRAGLLPHRARLQAQAEATSARGALTEVARALINPGGSTDRWLTRASATPAHQQRYSL